MNPKRRGNCPGIDNPMPTGDGLLARMAYDAPISVAAFAALCDASRDHGNGIIEITQRGSIQVRGLTQASAPSFAKTVAALELGTHVRPPFITSPLLGLDVTEEFDARDLVSDLRCALTERPYLSSLDPKVSVLIDGGGTLHLDLVSADIRLQATGAGYIHLALGGDARNATNVGWIDAQHAASVVDRLLEYLAARGPTARMRDLKSPADIAAIRATLADHVTDGHGLTRRHGLAAGHGIAAGHGFTPRQDLAPPAPPPAHPRMTLHRPPAEPLGTHLLRSANVARGFALAFGHSTAAALHRLASAAAANGAESIRPSPGRALLVVGLSHSAADQLAAVAADLGFIVAPNDPRRQVIACAGAPACASATLPTRELAPQVVRAAGNLLDGSMFLHLSGCAKGCAHPGIASLTFAGSDRVILNGTADASAYGTYSPTQLIAGIERLRAERERRVGESSANVLTRLGAVRVLELMNGQSARE